MIKFEKTETMGWEGAIRGMRNPMNSWDKSDTFRCWEKEDCAGCVFATGEGHCDNFHGDIPIIGPNDLDLARRLAKGGPVHAKYRRQIFVSVDITAPLYWWKEFDTYKVGTTTNSCSTMHKIHAKEFVLDDFSHEHLLTDDVADDVNPYIYGCDPVLPIGILEILVKELNFCRDKYLETKNKKYWYQMIQLLPSSYNQKRTVTMTYENLYNAFQSRKDHKLDEWRVGFCEWAKSLPYSELFTMEWEEKSHEES